MSNGETLLERSAVEIPIQLIAEAAWRATGEERRVRYHSRGACPTRMVPYGPVDPAGRNVHELCRAAGCLDLAHDLILRVQDRLAKISTKPDGGRLRAYVYRVASTELVEYKRAERVKLGFPAKPGRSDGVIARVNAELEKHESPQCAWFVTLFRILRCYPFSPQHVPGRWPLEGLCVEREQYFPDDSSTTAVVSSEIAHVLEVAVRVVGADWVYRTITLPLQITQVQLDVEEVKVDALGDDVEALMGNLLRSAYQANRLRGLSQSESFAMAAKSVTGKTAPRQTVALTSALAELEPNSAVLPTAS